MAMADTIEQVGTDIHRVTDGHVNAYFVVDGDSLTLIDTGFPWQAGRLAAAIGRLGHNAGDLSAILLTHAHADHLGGAEPLRSRTGAAVHLHRDEVPTASGAAPATSSWVLVPHFLPHLWRLHALRFVSHAALNGFLSPRPVKEATSVDDGQVVDVPGHPHVVSTPGHTLGHCSYVLPDRGALFSGDALVTLDVLSGDEGPRLMPPPVNSDQELARSSLPSLAEQDTELLLPGHGAPHRGPIRDAVAQATAR